MNREDVANALIKAGANVDLRERRESKTPLDLAAQWPRMAAKLRKVHELWDWLHDVSPELDAFRTKFCAEEIFLDGMSFLTDPILAGLGIANAELRTAVLQRAKQISRQQQQQQQQQATASQSAARSPQGSGARPRSAMSLGDGPSIREMPALSNASPATTSPTNSGHTSPTQDGAFVRIKQSLSVPQKWVINQADIEFVERVGSGSAGKVYRAMFRGRDCVAVKVIKTEESLIEDLRKELDVLGAVEDPNIIKFFGVCFDPRRSKHRRQSEAHLTVTPEAADDVQLTTVGLVTEFCDRDSLYTVLNDQKLDIGWGRTLKWAAQYMRGLLRLHTNTPQILHRDFKSLNILVVRDWTLRVGDFGLSRFNVESAIDTLSHTAGTTTHMAPEVFPREDGVRMPFTDRGDVYSAGIVLWEIVHRTIFGTYGKPWFSDNLVTDGPQLMVSIYLLLQRGVRPTLEPSDTPQKGKCPPAVVELYRSMVAKNPEDRPDTQHVLATLAELFLTYRENKEAWDAYRIVPPGTVPILDDTLLPLHSGMPLSEPASTAANAYASTTTTSAVVDDPRLNQHSRPSKSLMCLPLVASAEVAAPQSQPQPAVATTGAGVPTQDTTTVTTAAAVASAMDEFSALSDEPGTSTQHQRVGKIHRHHKEHQRRATEASLDLRHLQLPASSQHQPAAASSAEFPGSHSSSSLPDGRIVLGQQQQQQQQLRSPLKGPQQSPRIAPGVAPPELPPPASPTPPQTQQPPQPSPRKKPISKPKPLTEDELLAQFLPPASHHHRR